MQGGRLYTTAQVWVPGGLMARVLGVESHEIWKGITRLPSAEVELSKTLENPHVCCFVHCCQRSLLGGRHGTRAVAHEVFVDHYYTCVDVAYACSVSVRVGVLVRWCLLLPYRV